MEKNDFALGVIGAGQIGGALLSGLLRARFLPREKIKATTAHEIMARDLAERLHIDVSKDNRSVAENSDVLVIAVKPQKVGNVLREVRDVLDPKRHLVISLASGIFTDQIERAIGKHVPVIRVMPNMPISVGSGMSVICRGKYATPEQMTLTEKMLKTVGEVLEVEEEMMNAVTGFSASGPAYIYVIIESLAEAGVKVGFSRETATRLAAQTVLGSADMVLKTGEHPAKLKDGVTTPAGVTIDGLMELEEGKLRVTLIKAIVMSTRRAEQIHQALRDEEEHPEL